MLRSFTCSHNTLLYLFCTKSIEKEKSRQNLNREAVGSFNSPLICRRTVTEYLILSDGSARDFTFIVPVALDGIHISVLDIPNDGGMAEAKPNQVEKLKIPMDDIRKYVPSSMTPAEMLEYLLKLVKREYDRQHNRDAR